MASSSLADLAEAVPSAARAAVARKPRTANGNLQACYGNETGIMKSNRCKRSHPSLVAVRSPFELDDAVDSLDPSFGSWAPLRRCTATSQVSCVLTRLSKDRP